MYIRLCLSFDNKPDMVLSPIMIVNGISCVYCLCYSIMGPCMRDSDED